MTPFCLFRTGHKLDLTPLLRALLMMAAVYYIGYVCTWTYNYNMIYVSQGC